MKSHNSAFRRYYRDIRNYLPCSGRTKKRIIGEIQKSVNTYLEEYPNADVSEIENRFGTPCNIAASYLCDMSETELMQSLNVSQRIVKITVSTFLTIVLLWAIAVGSCIVMSKNRTITEVDLGIFHQAASSATGE